MVASKKQLAAAAAAVVAVARAQGPCGAGGAVLTLEQNNAWCGDMNLGSEQVEVPQCCAGASAARRLHEALAAPSTQRAPRALQGEASRGIETSAAYCDADVDARCEAFLGDGDVLEIQLEMSNLGDPGTCCKTCKCFGDPECVSFQGEKDEWILCDGRHSNSCRVTEANCKKKKDHAGNRCSYIKNDPTKWTSWEDSGSPCQPDWDVSGYPELLMYGTEDFMSVLRLGERGIIRDLIIKQSGVSSNRTLNADRCFERVNAWTGGNVPNSWKRSTKQYKGKEVEVTWNIMDEETGIQMVVACTSGFNSTRHRIDVRSLIEVDETRISNSNSDGVCKTGSITEKGGLQPREKAMHQRCLAKNIPSLLYACKALVDAQCQDYTIDTNIQLWCEHADLARLSPEISIEECKSELLSGEDEERAVLWAEMVCEINQDNIQDCTTLVSQFGWYEYLVTKSNGVPSGELEGPGLSTCEGDPMAYTTNSDECAEGVSVQYLEGGDWKELFFIPALLPPCGNEMSFTASQAPELFKYKIRFVQNELNAACLLENECRATQELKVAVNFNTENCPCANPVSPNNEVGVAELVGEYTVTTVFEIDKVTCSGTDTNFVQIGCGSGFSKQPVQVSIKDCSTVVEVLVSLEGESAPLTCLVNSGIELHVNHTLSVSVAGSSMTVSLDNAQVCYQEFDGAPMGGFDQCVYTSAPALPAASVCASVSVENQLCDNVLTPGNFREENISGLNDYALQGSATLEYFVCGKGMTNVLQVGCENETFLFSLDVMDCSGDAVATVGLASGELYTCDMPALFTMGKPSDFRFLVEDESGDAHIEISKGIEEVVCSTLLPGFAPVLSTCIYTSAPDIEPAYACDVVSTLFGNSETTRCESFCTPGSLPQKVCDGTQEQVLMGECEQCCPDNSTIHSNVEPICRDISISQPFCNPSVKTEASMCKALERKNADALLTLFIELNYTSEVTCCESCACYGDPECQAFDGSEDKWILCDGRGDDCKVNKTICQEQTDHGGNACVFNEEVSERILRNPFDIGAYGSSCLPNWESSGTAFMTMYNVENFEARLSMGERGVIEALEITLEDGTYTLVADECFEGSTYTNAWEISDGAMPLDQALNIKMIPGPGKRERTMEITDPVSNIFIRAVCIKHTSSNGKVTSFRMNINNLVETDGDRAKAAADVTTSGYCAQKNAVIDTMRSDRSNSDEIYGVCLMNLADAHLLCKQLWNPSCTHGQVALGVERWCQAANVYPNDPNRVKKCISYIGTDAQRWEKLYCEAISSQRPDSMSVATWKKVCVADLETDGYVKYVNDHTKGTLPDSGVPYCADSVKMYSTQKNACVPGVKVETKNSQGQWKEEFFIPTNLPPCNGTLEISASTHYNFFTRPIRFTQCEVDANKCSIDLGCLPLYELNMSYQFTYDSDFVCPTRRLI